MRILHLADVHLDRPFLGLPQPIAAEQRRALFDAFRRALELARARAVDLVTIGGDLWEEEHVKDDTRASVAYELGKLDLPVLAVCGNHDPLIAGGSYLRTDWPRNVTIVERGNALKEHQFGDVCVWSLSWGGGDFPARTLEHFHTPDDGRIHLALVHGTAVGAHFFDADGSHFPFDPARLREAGFVLSLAGHIHAAGYVNGVVYPGSPEPLGWGETDRHCVAIADVSREDVSVDLVDVNRTRFETLEADCSGCDASAAVRDVVERSLPESDPGLLLRIRLQGEVGLDCAIDPATIQRAAGDRYRWVKVEDRTAPALDITGRAERRSLDGLFARKLLERIEHAPDDDSRRRAQLALEAGLRAIDGREVLRVG